MFTNAHAFIIETRHSFFFLYFINCYPFRQSLGVGATLVTFLELQVKLILHYVFLSDQLMNEQFLLILIYWNDCLWNICCNMYHWVEVKKTQFTYLYNNNTLSLGARQLVISYLEAKKIAEVLNRLYCTVILYNNYQNKRHVLFFYIDW